MLPKKTESEIFKAFVDEYCIDNNAERAARAIGVRPSDALMRSKRLLAKPEIKELIAIRQDEIKKNASVNPDWVLTELKHQYQMAKADGDRNASIKTLEMLAKHTGLFARDEKQSNNVTVVVQNYADVKIEE